MTDLKLQEEDLKQRGPGDFFGVRQSGDLRFKIGDIFSDSKVLKEAADAAALYLQKMNCFVGRKCLSEDKSGRIYKGMSGKY